MSDLKAILHEALEEVWNKGNVDAIASFYHPEYYLHAYRGIDLRFKDLSEDLSSLKTACPDFHETVFDMIHEDDQVVARLMMSGTPLMDLAGLPPVGERFEVHTTDIYRFCEDKIIEQWG